MFLGFGVIESVELITQYNPKLSKPYFSNYVYNMSVFSMADEGETFNWYRINARRNPDLSTAEVDKFDLRIRNVGSKREPLAYTKYAEMLQ